MRDETVARNYAETLFDLASRHDGIGAYGEGIETVARLIDENRDFRTFLETPRIDAQEKKKVIREVFSDELPKNLINFLLITVDKRRQRLLREISTQFHALVDEHENRVHVEVTVARPVDAEMTEELGRGLSQVLGLEAIPHVRVKPEILGGVIVRAGDTIYDGSLRTRMSRLKKRLLAADLPE